MRQKDLCGTQAVLAKNGFIDLNEAHLPDGSGRLKVMDFMRTSRPAESFHPFGNGTGRDHQDFKSPFPKLGNLRAPTLDGSDIEASAFIRDQRGTHFHNDPACP